MSLFTREELLALATEYKRALKHLAHAKSYSTSTRTLTRQDLPEVRKQLAWIERELHRLDGRGTPIFARPRFDL